jgi:hypothetical protein
MKAEALAINLTNQTAYANPFFLGSAEEMVQAAAEYNHSLVNPLRVLQFCIRKLFVRMFCRKHEILFHDPARLQGEVRANIKLLSSE